MGEHQIELLKKDRLIQCLNLWCRSHKIDMGGALEEGHQWVGGVPHLSNIDRHTHCNAECFGQSLQGIRVSTEIEQLEVWSTFITSH